MSRLVPIPYGSGLLLVPERYTPPAYDHDVRIVKPARRRRGFRRA